MAMAATLTVAGVVGAVSQGANLLSKAGTQAPAKLCKDCKGEGRVACDLCQGTGQIRWEGKYRHKDECPSCEGRGEAKVSCWLMCANKMELITLLLYTGQYSCPPLVECTQLLFGQLRFIGIFCCWFPVS
jgi:DnaJ-class molecular chaperone